MESAMVDLEIDGKKVSVPAGTSVIAAADKLDIYIPRYCYHKNLSVAANCRMCLVEVENIGKPLPACATPVAADMKVFTQSAKALQAQRTVMEFLLINHPLDCPICDQAGMCELQDIAMGYGRCYSYFNEKKQATYSEDLGPLVETWMTRCIKCTRCVRFGEEVAGMRELGVVNRGTHSEISTYLEDCVDSELSGNIIDICPVGALTAKPSRYQARNYELLEVLGVALHDCVGSNVYWHMRRFQHKQERHVMATVPRENVDINETWISDRDRFAYCGLQHDSRLLTPKLKSASGEWRDVTWERGLAEAADKLKAILQNYGANQLAFIGSPNSSTEALYLLQKLSRGLGCDNVDHRLKQQDFSATEPLDVAPLGMRLNDLENQQSVLLIGSDVRYEQPLLSHRIRKASLNNAVIMSINVKRLNANFNIANQIIATDILSSVMQLAKALGVNHSLLDRVVVDEELESVATVLRDSEGAILLGLYALEHPQAMLIKWFAHQIERAVKGQTLGCLTHGANSSGARIAGALPHIDCSGAFIETPGLTVGELLGDKPVKAYLLLDFEAENDVAKTAKAIKALDQAAIVICLSSFVTDSMHQYADFIFPIAPYTECSGTYYNVEGRKQVVSASSVPMGDAKPAWKVLRVISHFKSIEN